VQRSAGVPDQREEVFTVAGEGVQCTQQLESLTGKRNQVLDACLHASGQNPPLTALKIELLPPRFAKLAGSDEEEEGELQCDTDNFAACVAVDRTQQFSETPRIGNAGPMTR